MTRDDFPFRNRYSPQSHRLCRNPLCLVCLRAERDQYEPMRYYPQNGQRLYIVRRQADREDAAIQPPWRTLAYCADLT